MAALAATAAQARELSGPQITSLVAGATVEIDTPTGTRLPVRYTQDGKMTGEARDLAWYLGSAVDNGRWWISGDQLCHKWLRWFNGEQQCLRLSSEGRLIRWLARDGTSGTARIIVPAAVAQASTLPAFGSAFAKRAPVAEEPPPARLEVPRTRELADPETAARPAPAPAPAAEPRERVDAPAADPAPAGPAGIVPPQPKPADRKSLAKGPPETPPAPRQAEPGTPPQPLFKVANVRHDDVLNVRSGPSADHDIVGELAPSSRGIAITSDCRSRWCPVQHEAMTGWVNSVYLLPEDAAHDRLAGPAPGPALRDAPEAPRACLTSAARALLERIEQQFGPVQVISTCRPGAIIAGTSHPSRHASGNAVDFKAAGRKAAIVEWLIANHRAGGTMTYAGMDHIHVDIGPHFVSIAGGPHWNSWSSPRRAANDD